MTATAGCGAEAAIGRLTRLTSLLLSIDRTGTSASDPDRQLQLQLLGRSLSASGAGSGSSSDETCCHAGMAASGNTSLHELDLECTQELFDGELAAAAAALPDLRQLTISQPSWRSCLGLQGLKGAGLAAFSACRRLRDSSLLSCSDLEGQQLVTHVPQISSLARLQLYGSMRRMATDSDARQLREAFYLEHGRHLQVALR